MDLKFSQTHFFFTFLKSRYMEDSRMVKHFFVRWTVPEQHWFKILEPTRKKLRTFLKIRIFLRFLLAARHIWQMTMSCYTPLESYILGLSDDICIFSVGAMSVEKIAFEYTSPISKIHPKVKSEKAMGPVISQYLGNQTSHRNVTPLPRN